MVYCDVKCSDSALRRAWAYVFWKIFGVSEYVACEIQMFTGICSLEDTLYARRLKFMENLVICCTDLYSVCL